LANVPTIPYSKTTLGNKKKKRKRIRSGGRRVLISVIEMVWLK
jgi:hypothetical protein